ncbi:MAG: DoxX family protein [Acidobacteria bacterium]|jgi:putative oxidoreductase|nr:MAG: DoxX family protein [Acidobacteriota bacterium]
MFRKIASLEPYALSLMRMVIGFTFSLHGMQKLFGFFGGMGRSGAVAQFPSLLWVAGALETFGGLLILVGLFTAPAAFILCGEMAVAYFRQHAPRGPWPILNGGELAVLYCFIYLHLVTAGGGAWSIDRFIRKPQKS